MTTLTANVHISPDHCPHKLPTSCRLTALPTCCACQDTRAHSSAYSKYIDGVGFVLRGTRQERYCWNCKVFWDARITVSGLHQSDAHIPEVPDQSNFLQKWFDWHRGYRIIRHEDGREEQQDLIGEALADVPSGSLPRTLDELRAGVTQESSDEASQLGSINPLVHNFMAAEVVDIDPEDRLFDLPSTSTSAEYIIPSPTHPTIHIPLHGLTATDLFNTAPGDRSFDLSSTSHSAESPPPTLPTTPVSSNIYLPPSTSLSSASHSEGRLANVQDRYLQVAALRREVQDLRSGIERIMSGLQELGEAVPESQDALQHTENLNTRLGNLEAHLNPFDRPRNSMAVNEQHEESISPRTRFCGSNFQVPPSLRPSSVPPEPHRPHVNINTITDTPYPYGGSNLGPRRQHQPRTRAPVRPEDQVQPRNFTQNQNLNVAEHQLSEARQRVIEARRNEQHQRHQVPIIESSLQHAQASLRRMTIIRETCERHLQDVEQTQRQTTALFGSREEIERQGYESPIAGMFNTYTHRYHAAEEQRRQERMLSEILAAEDRFVDSTVDGTMQTSLEHTRTVDEIRQQMQQESRWPRAVNNGNPQHLPLFNQLDTSVRQAMPVLEDVATGYNRTLHQLRRNATSAQGATSTLGSTSVSGSTPNRVSPLPAYTSTEDQVRQHINRHPRGLRRARAGNGADELVSQNGVTQVVEPVTFDTAMATLGHMAPATPEERQNLLRQLQEARQTTTVNGRTVFTARRGPSTPADVDAYLAGSAGWLPTFPAREQKSLDKDDGRPPPIVDDDEMMVKMECKICFAQVATVALTPCGHCVMCKWCAKEAIPSRKADQTSPADRTAQCPVCRKRVKSMQTIYGGETKDPKPKPDAPSTGPRP